METKECEKRLDLLHKVAQKAGSGSVTEVSNLLEQVLSMTQLTLRASASSVLLIDQEIPELYFRVVAGEAANELRQMRLSLDSGIAGWVARHVRPAIVNDVTRDERFNENTDKVTGFVTKSILAVPLVTGEKVIGVLEVLNKDDGSGFNDRDLEVLTALASTDVLKILVLTMATAINNVELYQAMLNGYKSTAKALVETVDAKDPYTYGHSQRVMEYALLGAIPLSLLPEELQSIEFGALLHDVGKIGINDSILRKPGGLTRKEWSAMHNHPFIGANIVGKVPSLHMARDVVLHHHERYDGNGYPEGLKGENISMGARLVAVADAFDTMTTDRSYRATLSADDALKELGKHVGTQFCPVAVEAFVSGFKERKEKLPEEAKEDEKLARKEAEQAAKEEAKREAEEAVHDISSEIYEGDVRLVIPSPAGFEQVRQFKERRREEERRKAYRYIVGMAQKHIGVLGTYTNKGLATTQTPSDKDRFSLEVDLNRLQQGLSDPSPKLIASFKKMFCPFIINEDDVDLHLVAPFSTE
jgi:HD-GYP domain-containing protein (c-di-GMP phosphodiesterase class II)